MESLAACPEISASPYELVGRADGRRRSGALLRVEFGDSLVGYADLHPWPELGDLSLKYQFELLTNNLASNLINQSIRFARIDAEHRILEKSCSDGLAIPASHVSLPYGFSTQDIRACRGSGSIARRRGQVGVEALRRAALAKEMREMAQARPSCGRSRAYRVPT